MAMCVKFITFVAILCLLAGHASAGMICAEWTGQGVGVCGVGDSDPNPSDSPSQVPVGWLADGDVGMAAVTIASVGGSALSAATILSPPSLPAPRLIMRLALEDDVLPPSPVLDGLIKPA